MADGILRCAQSPKHEVTFSGAGRALELLYTLTSRVYRRIAPGMFTHGSFSDESIGAHRGNLTEPRPGPRSAAGAGIADPCSAGLSSAPPEGWHAACGAEPPPAMATAVSGAADRSRRCCRIADTAHDEPASASALGGLTAPFANGNR